MELAIIAGRVSTKDQADKGFSLPEQVAAGQDYITNRYQLANIPGFSNVDEPQSGVFLEDLTGMAMDRPAIEAMRDAIREYGVKVIVYTEQDRLARKAIYQALLEEEFAELGARIEFVYDRFDETDEGQFFKGVKRELAEYDRKKRLRQMRTGKIGRAKAGKLLGGYQSPYGYHYDPSTGLLIIYEEEAEIVRLVFIWYVYGDVENGPLPAHTIADRLREMQIPTRGNGATRFPNLWSGTMVLNMLANETYTGAWYYKTTMIYTHVLNRAGHPVRSPLDDKR